MNISVTSSQSRPRAYLSTLLQYAFDLITVVSAQGTITYQSPSAERILGYSPDEMIGTSIYDYMEADERERVRCLWLDSAETSELCVFETTWQHKLEFPIYLECCIRHVVSGIDEAWIINAHDITERKAMQMVADERNAVIELSNLKVEEMLRRHTADLNAEKTRIESILDNSSDAIVLANSAGHINQTNGLFNQLFGLAPGEMLDQPLVLAISPNQWIEFSEALNAVIATGERTHIDVTACRADGGQFAADIALARLPAELNGDIVCSLRDITERKQMEESLRANERRFRGLFENNNDAVFIIGLDNIILAANTRAVNMLRYPVDEIIGSHASRFTVAESGDSSAESMFPDFSCGSVPIYERQFRRADGSIIEAEINVALVCGDDGRPMHIQSIVRDITERKRIEHELRESLAREKELGDMKMRFVSIVSHEFRTPLATIQAASDVLRYYSVKMTPDQIDLRFDKIQSTVKHMVSLLEDVLTLGQAQSGVLTANLEPINLVEFCQTVLDDLRAGNTKGGEIMFACNAIGTISVDADIKLLRQIITNLVTNARKYSPNGAPVQVRLTESVTSAVIEVVDSGIGIPEDDQKHLFEAFYRASNTGTISGTGLGLAITKRAVELHAGTISVKSTVGVGTTFIVTLPIRIH